MNRTELSASAHPPMPWRDAGIVVVIAIIYLVFPNRYPRFVSPNELSRILLTKAIVEERSVRLDRGVARTGEFSDLARSRGHYFSDKAPGLSLLAVPVYFVSRMIAGNELSDIDAIYICRLVTVTAPALLFALFLAFWFPGFSAARGIAVVMLYLGTTVFPQSLSFTGHVPMTILCFAASLVIVTSSATPLSGRRAAIAGVLVGLALLIDISSAIFCVIAVPATRRLRPALFFLTAFGMVASLWLVYNYVCFNDPFDVAYHHMLRPRDLGNRAGALLGVGIPRLDALWGLTFSPIRGIFVHSPFAFAWVVVAFRAVRSRVWQNDIFILGVPLAYLFATSSLPDWQGGWSLGCRYLTPAMPFIAIAAARVFEEGKGRLWLTAASVWAIVLHILAMATWSMPPYDGGFRFPALELPWFLAMHGAFAPTFALVLGASPAIVTVTLVLLGIVATLLATTPTRLSSILVVLATVIVFVTVAAFSSQTLPRQSSALLKQVGSYMGYSWRPAG